MVVDEQYKSVPSPASDTSEASSYLLQVSFLGPCCILSAAFSYMPTIRGRTIRGPQVAMRSKFLCYNSVMAHQYMSQQAITIPFSNQMTRGNPDFYGVVG